MCLKKKLFKKYVYRQDISMNKSPISIIVLLKIGWLCWEADVNGVKLRNLILIFKTVTVKRFLFLGSTHWIKNKHFCLERYLEVSDFWNAKLPWIYYNLGVKWIWMVLDGKIVHNIEILCDVVQRAVGWSGGAKCCGKVLRCNELWWCRVWRVWPPWLYWPCSHIEKRKTWQNDTSHIHLECSLGPFESYGTVYHLNFTKTSNKIFIICCNSTESKRIIYSNISSCFVKKSVLVS